MRARLTDAQKLEAQLLYASNERVSLSTLCEVYGVGQTVMRRALTGVQKRKPGGVSNTVPTDMLRAYYSEGLTYAEIGVKVGMSESGVWRRLNKGEQG